MYDYVVFACVAVMLILSFCPPVNHQYLLLSFIPPKNSSFCLGGCLVLTSPRLSHLKSLTNFRRTKEYPIGGASAEERYLIESWHVRVYGVLEKNGHIQHIAFVFSCVPLCGFFSVRSVSFTFWLKVFAIYNRVCGCGRPRVVLYITCIQPTASGHRDGLRMAVYVSPSFWSGCTVEAQFLGSDESVDYMRDFQVCMRHASICAAMLLLNLISSDGGVLHAAPTVLQNKVACDYKSLQIGKYNITRICKCI
ncbi:hypothetical protein BGX38DRAFT_541991 [Terfezia claveryi]|nr:hypothetical protein BGX38DRAFT_541991 [Terfezia claveryi]